MQRDAQLQNGTPKSVQTTKCKFNWVDAGVYDGLWTFDCILKDNLGWPSVITMEYIINKMTNTLSSLVDENSMDY